MTAIEKAADCSRFADALVWNLLAASSTYTTTEQKLFYMKRAFVSYEALKPRMAELAVLAKNSAAAGSNEAESLREIAGASA